MNEINTTEPLRPCDAQDVEAAVRDALAAGRTLEVVSAGSKRAFGRASQYAATLDLSALSGVTLYEPEELVLSARAATPLREIEAMLADKGQALAFEPMDMGPLFGGPADAGTLGGALACNLSGPRRFKAGAARDHFLGAHAVSGRGETFKTGGRVVKNVTGYDLCKLLAGSHGTLAVMTEVTIKVLPAAETEVTLVLSGLGDPDAMRAMAKAVGSAADVAGAAHLPSHIAHRFDGLSAQRAATVFRLEGVAPSVAHRALLLTGLLGPLGDVSPLDEAHSRKLWRAIRDATPFAAGGPSGERDLWRISTAPSRAAELVAMLSPAAQVFYDWAGGLIWLALPPTDHASAVPVRAAVAACGGHATLIRAPVAVRAVVDVFQPPEAGVAALSRRIKAQFDPQGILNPGRMWAQGI